MSTSLKFYTDTHIAKAVAAQLRARGVDIVRCEEVGMAEASDFEHLEYATREGRVMITNDQDFLILVNHWSAQGRNHNGIMFCENEVQGTIAIGIIIKECLFYHEMIDGGAGTIEDDIVNHVLYIS